jgi:hypothetical protein
MHGSELLMYLCYMTELKYNSNDILIYWSVIRASQEHWLRTQKHSGFLPICMRG